MMKQRNFNLFKTRLAKSLVRLEKRKATCLSEQWVIEYNILAIKKALIAFNTFLLENEKSPASRLG